jgi:hypothetical protein
LWQPLQDNRIITLLSRPFNQEDPQISQTKMMEILSREKGQMANEGEDEKMECHREKINEKDQER